MSDNHLNFTKYTESAYKTDLEVLMMLEFGNINMKTSKSEVKNKR